MKKKELLELNSIKWDFLGELTIMYCLSKCIEFHIRDLKSLEMNEERFKALESISEKMENNFNDMEIAYSRLSNFISKLVCEI